ncbi:molybdopterin molybdotransferase MoeA [Cucumibacter marinus]|uniref:molybdopterin molybdotransferase MoeA n=1 Tax=Cucumibacter marinus TaxID=1121252 RepID=UPI0003F4BEC7|nr:gephyrin-like molybdotransferase Glp [Cucumibacter marinus]
MIDVDEAIDRILRLARPLPAQTVPLADAAGHFLTGPVSAHLDNPRFDASAMDGYAVRAQDQADTPLRVIGRSEAGSGFEGEVGPGEAVRIFTGAPVPNGADAVVMQEKVQADGDSVRLDAAPSVGQNIRRRGSDFAEGDTLIDARSLLGPAGLALMAASGHDTATVHRLPRISIISTGDELVPIGTRPGPDQIVASNALALTALLRPFGSHIADLGIVKDDPVVLQEAIERALSLSDVVFTIGGASVGERDFVKPALESAGVTLDFWKLKMRPGKPLMVGNLGDKLVFGLPGNPVSALVTARVAAIPALRALAGSPAPRDGQRRLPLTGDLPANGFRRHFLRARTVETADGLAVEPLLQTDSAHLTSLAAADCLIVQAEDDPGMPEGTPVSVIELNPSH